jgi:hypothetical protein
MAPEQRYNCPYAGARHRRGVYVNFKAFKVPELDALVILDPFPSFKRIVLDKTFHISSRSLPFMQFCISIAAYHDATTIGTLKRGTVVRRQWLFRGAQWRSIFHVTESISDVHNLKQHCLSPRSEI